MLLEGLKKSEVVMGRYYDDTVSHADMYGDYVAHHGILGMKWGVRRYQNKDGSLTPKGKARYKLGKNGELVKLTHKEKKARKKQLETLNRARIAAKQKQLEADQIRKIVSSGSAVDVYNNRRRMSPEQIAEAYNRLSSDQRLAQLALNEKNLQPKKKSAVDKVLGVMDKTTKAINTGVGLANAIGGAKKLIQGDDPTGAKAYEKALDKAIRSGDLSNIAPYTHSMTAQNWKDFNTVRTHQDRYFKETGAKMR